MTTIDRTTSRDILAREAEKNNPEAFLHIALHYASGTNGFAEDEAMKIEFYQRGAAFADQGLPAALYCQAVCRFMGYGVDKDEKEAVKQFREIAEQGYALAQNVISRFYSKGEGIDQNDQEAFKWRHKAAELTFDQRSESDRRMVFEIRADDLHTDRQAEI